MFAGSYSIVYVTVG